MEHPQLAAGANFGEGKGKLIVQGGRRTSVGGGVILQKGK